MVLRVRVRACTVATTSPSWSLESRRTRVASLPAMGVRSVITRSVAAYATPCTTADALGDHLARCQGIGAVPADRSRSLWPMAIPHDACEDFPRARGMHGPTPPIVLNFAQALR